MIRAATLLVCCLLVLSGCETTREKSARLAASNDFTLREQHGVDVKRANSDVKVTDTAVLTDDFGQAAVVVMKVDAERPLLNVPIELTIEGKGGKQLFKNDTPGLDAALTGPAALPARGEVFWIYDQLTLSGKAGKITAQAGAGEPLKNGSLPEFNVSPGKLERDPDGIVLIGQIRGEDTPLQRKLVIYGLARRHGKIVAAGTAQLEKLSPNRRTRFQMFFVGDPSDADIKFFVPPTALS